MTEMFRQASLYTLFLMGAGLVVLGILIYDALVQIERERFFDEWVRDGRPTTVIRTKDPKDGIPSFSAAILCVRWALFPPGSFRKDVEAASKIRWLRAIALLWTVALVPALFYLMFVVTP